MTAATVPLRERAEQARQAAIEMNQESDRKAAGQVLDKMFAEMQAEAVEQLGSEILDSWQAYHRDGLLVELDDGILLHYYKPRHDGYRSDGEFYLAEPCGSCGGLATGHVRVGSRFQSTQHALVELGEALAAGVRHQHEDEEENVRPAPVDQPKTGYDLALERAMSGMDDSRVAALIAIALKLDSLCTAVYNLAGA